MADVPVSATARPPADAVRNDAARYAVRTYAAELAALVVQLDREGGWYAVFAGHDPQGLRECLSGREVPPWDVVASLLEDFAQLHGPGPARRLEERLRLLHGDATAAYDLRAGGASVLRSRLAVAEGELAEAAARVRALKPDGGAELAWARDHLARAEARRAELRERRTALDAAVDDAVASDDAAAGGERGERTVVPQHEHVDAAGPQSPSRPNRRQPRGGSRFAGGAPVEGADASGPAAIVPPGAPSPDLAPRTAGEAGSGAGAEPAPRGARFAGAVRPPATAVPAPEVIAGARTAAQEAAALLTRLRSAGSGGEAHALLCDAASRQPLQFAVLVDELHCRGMASDAGILLWEAAALPVEAFAAAADALSSLGRAEDSARLLRQGAHRPPPEVAQAALALHRAGREDEAAELLAAVIRARTPAGAAQVALADPAALVGLVLDAARKLSQEQGRRVADALRAAGVPGVPGAM